MKTKDYSMREMIIDQCLGTGREYTREELMVIVNKELERRDMMCNCLMRSIRRWC